MDRTCAGATMTPELRARQAVQLPDLRSIMQLRLMILLSVSLLVWLLVWLWLSPHLRLD